MFLIKLGSNNSIKFATLYNIVTNSTNLISKLNICNRFRLNQYRIQLVVVTTTFWFNKLHCAVVWEEILIYIVHPFIDFVVFFVYNLLTVFRTFLDVVENKRKHWV